MLLRVTPVQVDLVPPHVVVAWRHYFSTKYPSLRVVCFTFHSDQESSMQPQQNVHLRFRRTRGKGLSAVGPKELLWEVVQIHLRQGCVCVCVCGVWWWCVCVCCVCIVHVCSVCVFILCYIFSLILGLVSNIKSVVCIVSLHMGENDCKSRFERDRFCRERERC